MIRRLVSLAALAVTAVAALLVAVALHSSSTPRPVTATTTAPAEVAEANAVQVPVYASPDATTPSQVLGADLPSGTPRSFLVVDATGPRLRALLPDGPNGATGYLQRSDVVLRSEDMSVDISLSAHQLTVRQSGQVVLTAPVGAGAPATPTPTGPFFVTDLLQPPDPAGAYGPYAFGLSGHSQVLHYFDGGDGQIGLHGTDDPTSIGRSVTHGCIRVSNDVIERLARMLPLGTPVTVTA